MAKLNELLQKVKKAPSAIKLPKKPPKKRKPLDNPFKEVQLPGERLTGGSWETKTHKGMYEIYLDYNKEQGSTLTCYSISCKAKERFDKGEKKKKEIVLGDYYFTSHTIREFYDLLKKMQRFCTWFDVTKYQILSREEFNRNGRKLIIRSALPNPDQIEAGADIFFGSYYQDNRFQRIPIEWTVLEVKNRVALLISKKCLITCGYYEKEQVSELSWSNVYWSESQVRRVCEGVFMPEAFLPDELNLLDKKPITDKVTGSVCEDPIFILSEEEVQRLLPTDPQRKGEWTNLALKQGARPGWSGGESCACWWILPHGYKTGLYPQAVTHDGQLYWHSRSVNHSDFTIRPCILLNLDRLADYIDRLGGIVP